MRWRGFALKDSRSSKGWPPDGLPFTSGYLPPSRRSSTVRWTITSAWPPCSANPNAIAPHGLDARHGCVLKRMAAERRGGGVRNLTPEGQPAARLAADAGMARGGLIDPVYQRSVDTGPSQSLIRKIAMFWDWGCASLSPCRGAPTVR
jgi:hypothetical protein